MAGLTIKLTQYKLTGKKGKFLICVQGGLIEIRPEKWPKKAAFILFGQRNNTLVRN